MVRILTITILSSLLLIPAIAASQSSLESRPLDPEQDPAIDMFMGCWTESIPYNTHGTITERAILSPLVEDDPLKPMRRGAVLEFVTRFSRATLDPLSSTIPVTLDGEQEIFYIQSGTGMIETTATSAELRQGIFVLVPAGCEFTITNTCDQSRLEMYLIVEPVPSRFRPNPDILVRDEKNMPFRDNGYLQTHWSHNGKNIFNTDDGLGTLEAVNMLTFNAMTVGQPHSHGEGAEEVWTVVEGTNLAFLGKEVRWQKPGTAYKIPPNGQTPHSNINQFDDPVKFLFFARWQDHELRP